jgi:hypothetical protein
MKSALVHRRFTKETEGYPVGFLILRGKRDSSRQGNLAANDSVTAKKIKFLIEDMHRAALAARGSTRFAIQFGHDGIRRNALGDSLTMLTITCEHVVIFAQG